MQAPTLLRRRDQEVVAVAVVVGLVALLAWRAVCGPLVDVDQLPPTPAEYYLDINTAQWPELTLLPRIGPQLAQRIVAYRDARGPFHHHDDLLGVRGIGPKTLSAMRPYLMPIAVPSSSAAAGDRQKTLSSDL